MKVKLLTPLASAHGSFNVGDEYPCASGEEAQRLVDAGFAEMIRSKTPEKAVKRAAKREKAAK